MNRCFFNHILNSSLLKYIAIGAFNTLWGYCAILFLMYILEMSPTLANIIVYIIGAFVTYYLNRKLTFKSKKSKQIEFIQFIVCFLMAYFVNFYALMFSLNSLHLNKAISQLLAMVAYVMISYPLFKFFVFKQR